MAAEGRRYHVQHVLGRGGFGTVYQAEMISGGGFAKPVALKVLNQEMGGMAEVAQRLRDEARLLGRLKHPAILRVDDLVQLEGCWTVVMELLVGANLHQVVRTSGPLPLGIALEIAHVVAGALHAAHDRPGPGGEPLRVLHRDIKPSNIQLTPLGEVKVLDFGVARASFATREAATRSLIFGSVGYMAPERMAGRDSHAGDVYALGVVLYEILAGRRLGTACSQVGLQTTMVEDALASMVEQHPDEDLHALLRSAMAFEPEARPRADTFQRRARKLRARYPDPWLSDWAEAALRQVMADQDEGSGPLSGRVLHERGQGAAQAGDHEPPGHPRGSSAGPFTPLPFEPSEPHTPTAGQPAPWTDDMPSEPIGLPPLPQPRSRPTPMPSSPAPTVPRPAPDATLAPPEATPPPEASAEDPTHFERVPTPPPSSSTSRPLEEAGTAMAAHPVPASPPAPVPSPTPPPRRRAPLLAIGSAVAVMVVGLLVLLGPVRSALESSTVEELADPAGPVETARSTDDAKPELVLEPAQPPTGSNEPTPPAREIAPAARALPVVETTPATAASTEPDPEPEPDTPWGSQPEEAPAPAPEPAGPTPATVLLLGDATSIVLTNEAGSHGPGQVPPGHYVVHASFPGLDGTVRAGEVDLAAGQTVSLLCQSGFDRCAAADPAP
jgi:eukaryotic-like serine/threonine-protein kinase